MKVELKGYRKVDFKNREGQNVRGTNLYVEYESNGVEGKETGKLFIAPEMTPKNLKDYLGLELEIEFNQRGRVVQIGW